MSKKKARSSLGRRTEARTSGLPYSVCRQLLDELYLSNCAFCGDLGKAQRASPLVPGPIPLKSF
jgi:hypothetical protein